MISRFNKAPSTEGDEKAIRKPSGLILTGDYLVYALSLSPNGPCLAEDILQNVSSKNLGTRKKLNVHTSLQTLFIQSFTNEFIKPTRESDPHDLGTTICRRSGKQLFAIVSNPLAHYCLK